ncbi:hypothetical protein MTR_3g466670 [Medicago truncatula]|uniref:Uncharacterized protein n=1 Tax=Medicago truncatula TaxID=3880 RepID=A0A072UXD0_MEDTR|nr:hypothetical protein MTR_3g466670 [Medicago truncatula]
MMKRGLGVKNLRVVNLSLLVKCRWRLIQYGKRLWKKFLHVKYGESIGNLVVEGGRKDVMPLEEVAGGIKLVLR